MNIVYRLVTAKEETALFPVINVSRNLLQDGSLIRTPVQPHHDGSIAGYRNCVEKTVIVEIADRCPDDSSNALTFLAVITLVVL